MKTKSTMKIELSFDRDDLIEQARKLSPVKIPDDWVGSVTDDGEYDGGWDNIIVEFTPPKRNTVPCPNVFHGSLQCQFGVDCDICHGNNVVEHS